VALDIIKLRQIGFAVLVTKQVFRSHHDERLTEFPVYLGNETENHEKKNSNPKGNP
jgi:hypothetical protein